MKKIYSLITAVLLTATFFLPQQASAQTPEKMSYQAVVRGANNNVVANQGVGMQISILQGSANGSAIYVETQNPTTNTSGLISVEIGTGTTSDDFSTIDWAAGPFFIKTETDPTGGTNYTITGTSQLMSVPYALYAKTSGSSIPGPAGTNGLDGANGIDGAIGATGPAGAVGPTGTAGTQGVIGLTGVDGAVGATGPQGVAGIDGAIGATGANGAVGAQGATGADGSGIAQTLSQSGNTITLSDGGGSATFTDTDTQLDAAGVTALGFTSGAHTTKYTDAEAVAAVGAHTTDTDTHIDAAGVTALGFVSGAHTVEIDGSITNEIQNLSSVLTESTDAGGANITNLADPTSAQDAATKAYVDLLISQIENLQIATGTYDFTDADGNSYNLILVNGQYWMVENLRTTKYNDGTSIPNITDNAAWASASTPAYSWYNNDEATYKNTYGAMYNWYAIDPATNGGKNICPTNWHVATDDDWTVLTNSLGGESVAGGKMKESGTTHWLSPNTGATDEIGLAIVPGGHRISINGTFNYVGGWGAYWTSTSGYWREFSSTLTSIYRASSAQYSYGFSVRCVKD